MSLNIQNICYGGITMMLTCTLKWLVIVMLKREDDVGDVQEDEVGDVRTDDVGDVNTEDVCDVQEDENKDSGSSEDSDFKADGLSYDDSEDERALGLDDCFEDRGRSSGVKSITKKHKLTSEKVITIVDNASSFSGLDNEMDINYASEEVGSSDPDASDEENDPKYPRKPKKTTTSNTTQPSSNTTQEQSQAQTQLIEVGVTAQEQPMSNEPQTEIDPKFEMLAANLAAAFEATRTQPNLVEIVTSPHSVPATSTHSAYVTLAHSAPVTSS
ncbi:hypothetical protein KIW84_043363 [Lathyrus oleraceus]|uniref:Uncharacterized protein n=1 Tax=Pisum sativum TaxID=3888 RepID=A0A9D4XF73_PEA|nr:hypothetical protein KIW84_043363 [Pisum sativum]